MEMRITWTTYNSGSPAVRWGTVPGQYTKEVAATTSTYTREQMCGAPANSTGWHDPGVFHSAVMGKLEACKSSPISLMITHTCTLIVFDCLLCDSFPPSDSLLLYLW
jgi:hypothetical protein